MSEGPPWVWDPRALREIRRSILRCSSEARPNIQVFQLAANPAGAPPEAEWAVLPSSFNPPTEAHAAMLRWGLDYGGFHRGMLLLDIHHADKGFQDAALEDRGLMLRLRFASEPRLTLGVCSHGRFLDKTAALESFLGRERRWSFLVGMDTVARVLDPRFYIEPERELELLFQRAGFVVFPREGVPPETHGGVERWRARGAQVRFVELPQPVRSISSSAIRDRRARGLPLLPDVSPAVAAFIEETGLYLPDTSRTTRYGERKRWLADLFERGPEDV